MSRTLALGLFLGALVTAAAGYLLSRSNILVPEASNQKALVNMAQTTPESADAALVQSFTDFVPTFPGNEDLIARRAKLRPFVTTEDWDRIRTSLNSPEQSSSQGCQSAEPASAIFLPEAVANSIADGSSNIIFKSTNLPRCFTVGSRIVLGIDNSIHGGKLYDIRGEILVDRIFEDINIFEQRGLLKEFRLEVEDALYLANLEMAPLRRPELATVLHVVFKASSSALDRTKIPHFVAGAETVGPEHLVRLYRQSPVPMIKPILVDARDRHFLPAGPTYAGAILASFVASNPEQIRYRPDLTTSILAGAKFDIHAITELESSRDVPLVIFGNDETDATPLWVIRNLRLQNYRNLLYVAGGLKAMNLLKEPIVFE
jgi:hypothetical protein